MTAWTGSPSSPRSTPRLASGQIGSIGLDPFVHSIPVVPPESSARRSCAKFACIAPDAALNCCRAASSRRAEPLLSASSDRARGARSSRALTALASCVGRPSLPPRPSIASSNAQLCEAQCEEAHLRIAPIEPSSGQFRPDSCFFPRSDLSNYIQEFADLQKTPCTTCI